MNSRGIVNRFYDQTSEELVVGALRVRKGVAR